jgi:hypothetical protein
MEDPVKFKTVYTGTPYEPTAIISANGEAAPRHAPQSKLRIHAFTAAPIADAVVN